MRSIATGGILAGAILLCAGGTAQAMDSTLEASVPFSFVVNGKNMPAGKYLIKRDDTSPWVLLIRGEKDNHVAVLVSTVPDGGRDPSGSRPVLTFKRTENQYRLTAVWDSQDEGFDVLGR
jgi:hypothetical protein